MYAGTLAELDLVSRNNTGMLGTLGIELCSISAFDDRSYPHRKPAIVNGED